jgi:hypothetical protein
MIRGILRRPDDHKGVAAMKKKYLVELTKEQRVRLRDLISAGIAPARMLTRARILLKADTGGHAGGGPALSDGQVAEMLETSTATVGRVRERFWRQGLDAALERSMPDRVYKRTLDGRAEAHLIALACSEAPEGRDRWSMRLLADKAVELGIVDAISHETVRKTLKKTSCVPTSSKGG